MLISDQVIQFRRNPSERKHFERILKKKVLKLFNALIRGCENDYVKEMQETISYH